MGSTFCRFTFGFLLIQVSGIDLLHALKGVAVHIKTARGVHTSVVGS